MMDDQFKDKTVLVTGGTGSIGREIVYRVLKQKPKLVKIYARDEYTHWLLEKELEEQFPKERFQHIIGDIRDEKRLDLALNGVDIVFHTAGLKHIPYAEQNPEEALEINTEGGRTVLHYAAQNRVSKVIAISTDKAVYPASIMGITKLLMERLFIADWRKHGIETTFAIVRMGNIFNTRGSVVQRWIEQARSGYPITLTDKSMRRFLISIEQSVDFIFKVCHIMVGREIFIPKMEEVNMFELAQKIIGEHGAGKKIEIVLTGMREREKITELLFTNEEKETTLEKTDYFVVLPNKKLFEERKKTYG
jgi:FlaA1/EpsC-like NDP-sugar epimerase